MTLRTPHRHTMPRQATVRWRMVWPCVALLWAVTLSHNNTLASPENRKAAQPPTWPTLSPDEHAGTIDDLKTFAGKTRERVNGSLALLETKFFIFCTDLEPAETRKWAKLLDKMYNRLCALFAVAKGTNIWRGKALVFVFQQKDHYRTFWKTMMDVDPKWSAGMCQSYGDGRVIIAFYRQPEEMDFATILVHESVHGFLHRYRSPQRIVSWANEGLADVIAAELVPQGDWGPRKKQRAHGELKKRGHMGGDFFSKEQISPWQYGVAMDLTTFMIRSNKRRYVAFINGIKGGLTWEKSLATRYGVSHSRLVSAYGRSIGIKTLVP